MASLCQERGLVVETVEEIWADAEQVNVIARPQSERPAVEFMLQAHLDTVDPGPFGFWAETGHNPFDAHIIDGKIYGLGAADVKLDLLCKLEAICSFSSATKWKLPPVLVGTYGEELGMMGALKLIRKNKVSAKMALVGEPSDLRLLSAGKGIATVEIVIPYSEEEQRYRSEHNLRESTSTQSKIFHGKAAHSSAPHLGESAIKKMFEYLLNLPSGLVVMEVDGGVNFNTVPSHAFLEVDLTSGHHDAMASKISTIYREVRNLELEFLQHQDKEFYPNHPTLNIGIVRTLKDHVFISGNCRIPPIITNDIYEGWMRRLEMTCRSVGAQFRVTDYKRPYRTESDSILLRGCIAELEKLGLHSPAGTQSSTNEASLFSRVGIECVSFGAGQREGNIHTPTEHVAIEDLNKATEFYKNVIARFCI
jgi:succinyl-diaminopimelate desuccinylase